MKTRLNSANWIEIIGGNIIDIMEYAPDPNSFHGDFYYNSSENRLYKLVKKFDVKRRVRSNHWIQIVEEY
jgi:hypothetical protein